MAEQRVSEQTSTVSEQWCNIKGQFTKHIYNLVVDDFRANFTTSGQLTSTPFDDEVPHKLQWQLKIHLTHLQEICFSIILLKGSPVTTSVEFSILNPMGGEDYIAVKNCSFTSQCTTVSFALTRDSVLCDTKRIIYNNRLRVRFLVSIPNGKSQSSGSVPNRREASFKLSEDLNRLLENEFFSDVTLIVGTESFRAHKAVLAARSDVFAAMFQHDMLESAKNQVTIPDIKPEVFQETLRFIYTGEVGNSVLENMSLGMIAVADKYSLDELKKLCEEFLMKNLSSEIAAETLILADLHSANRLKARAIEFIKGNMAEVALTSGWFKLGANAHLINEFSTKQKD